MASGARKRRRAPAGCYWRGGVLWCRFQHLGREYRESLRTDDPATAERRRDAIRARIVGASFGERAVTWEAAVVAWGEDIAARVSPRTMARYATSLAMIGPLLAGRRIDQISTADLISMEGARRKAGVGSATIRRDLTAISSVLEHAIERGWREGNPARDRARRIREPVEPIVLPPPEDLATVRARLQAPRADYVAFLLATGARRDEARLMERTHVRDGVWTIYRAKGKRTRAVALSSEARAILERQPIAIGCRYVWHDGGRPLTANISRVYAAAVARAAKSAQRSAQSFTPHRLHDLRHVYAVSYLRSGGSIYDLQAILGHSSIKTTERYLAYITPEEAAATKAAGTKSGTVEAVEPVPTRQK